VLERVIKTEFHAAHHIAGHPKCGKTHGHTYKLTVKLYFLGWIDFADLAKLVELSIKPFDHTDLGDMTCEQLARRIHKSILENFQELFKINLLSCTVELFETCQFGVVVGE